MCKLVLGIWSSFHQKERSVVRTSALWLKLLPYFRSSPVHIIATSKSLHSYARPPPVSSSKSEPAFPHHHWKEETPVRHERVSVFMSINLRSLHNSWNMLTFLFSEVLRKHVQLGNCLTVLAIGIPFYFCYQWERMLNQTSKKFSFQRRFFPLSLQFKLFIQEERERARSLEIKTDINRICYKIKKFLMFFSIGK